MTSGAANLVADIRSDLRRRGAGSVGTVRAVRLTWSKTLKDQPPRLVMDVVTALAACGSWPERLVSFELLESHRGAFATLTAGRVNALGEGLAATTWSSRQCRGR